MTTRRISFRGASDAWGASGRRRGDLSGLARVPWRCVCRGCHGEPEGAYIVTRTLANPWMGHCSKRESRLIFAFGLQR